MKQANNIWLPDEDDFFTNRSDYEENDFNIAMKYVVGSSCALDVGAHVGFWTRRLLNRFEQVWAFEPVPQHYECLLKNTESANNVSYWPVAVGDKDGNVFINRELSNSGMSAVTETESALSVTLKTIDSFDISRRVNFIKIDVEGYELAVLKGAETLVKRDYPVLFIEILNVHRQNSGVFELLSNWGYTLVERTGENYIFKTRTEQ